MQAVLGSVVALAMTLAAWSGAVGLVIPTLWAALLIAATGLVLVSPAVRLLHRRRRRT